jgi:hypothetical protein
MKGKGQILGMWMGKKKKGGRSEIRSSNIRVK